MNIFDTSTELFDSDDETQENSTFDSASSSRSERSTVSNLSSVSSTSPVSDLDSLSSQSTSSSISNISSVSSASTTSFENMPIQTRRSRMADNDDLQSSASSDSAHSAVLDTDYEIASDHSSNISGSNHSNNSNNSSDTETYDIDDEFMQLNDDPVIEINDTQMPNDSNYADDDVILIPQNIETIDLCTQAATIPVRLRNEIIDITDSPGTQGSHFGPVRTRRRRGTQVQMVQNNSPELQNPQPTTSTPNTRTRLNFDDSQNESQPRFVLSCPICLDSMVNREPVSTPCGHLFCKQCIVLALQSAKKCPMCKKTLGARKPYFNIFLPC